MANWLPETHGGYVPYFLLYEGTAAIIHSIFCYTSAPKTSLTMFRGKTAPPPHGLTARVYAVKNLYSAAVRLYAAYHITDGKLYNLANITVAGAFLLYFTEVFVYKTTRVVDALFPFIFGGLGSLWMFLQRDFYVS
ncbi:hypothetical protein FSARC_11038 [Fusarium sarcochroum]|uniref:Ergosterol biosynthesis protein n=1 Tax=Fusarium sarcochroum TaxID=1208366 RepID=A0A8H4TI72_9HYPO|nr:hypothetical protein FSARC_11038 [Fusarium sarcochroum]